MGGQDKQRTCDGQLNRDDNYQSLFKAYIHVVATINYNGEKVYNEGGIEDSQANLKFMKLH